MQTTYYSIHKVNNADGTASVEQFQQQDEIDAYIDELVEQCVEQNGDREYGFDENRDVTKVRLDHIVQANNRDAECLALASRLAQIENSKNDEYANLMHDIPQGLLVVALVDMERDDVPRNRLIIAKADYTEFIEKTTGARTNGLPTKKKVFKSFIASFSIDNGHVDYTSIMTFDPQKNKATYWWNDFLELKQPRTDTDNTKTAMNVIKREILNKIKESHREAYLPLYGSTMVYMRTEGEFDLEYYRDVVFGGQVINDPTFNMATWQQKITNLPDGRKKFDRHFTKMVDEIKQPEVATDIELAPLVDLRIKGPFEGMGNVIKAIEYNGQRGVFIQSDNGYITVRGMEEERQ